MNAQRSPIPSWLWGAGLASIFVGERVIGGGSATVALDIIGGVLILASVALHAKGSRSGATAAHVCAHKSALKAQIAGIAALVIYALTALEVVAGESAELIALGIWPIVLFAATAVLVALDVTISAAPVVLEPRRSASAVHSALAAAFAISLLFPLNYLASAHNVSRDLTYFRTTEVGEATSGLVESLPVAVDVHIFQAPSSEVTAELLAYFGPIESDLLRVTVLDQAAHPALAERMRVPDNGFVAVSRPAPENSSVDNESDVEGEEASDLISEVFEIGEDLENAKRHLSKLDVSFHGALAEVALGTRTIYFTTGHREFPLQGAQSQRRKMALLKQAIDGRGYTLRTLEREVLLEAVPEDAAAVAIIGATDRFVPAELDALERFQDRGGAVMVALAPAVGGAASALNPLLERLGFKQEPGVLASERNILPSPPFPRPRLQDRVNLISGSFSSHPTTTTLSGLSSNRQAGIAWPSSAHISPIDDFEGHVATTIRSANDNWVDLDGDLEFATERGETRRQRPLAAAITGNGEEGEWRAVLFSSSEALADFWTRYSRGNLLLAADAITWMTGREESRGTIESEEDVRIVHSSEDDLVWLYGTTVGVPALVLLAGLLRTRSRRRSS